MIKVIFTFLLIFFLTQPLFASLTKEADTVWVRVYNGPGDGNDHAYAIAVDSSGNVYVTGGSGTIKYNAGGEILWIEPWSGYDLTLDDSGYVYVTGDSGTIKCNSEGGYLLLGPWGGGDVATDDSGYVYVTGERMGDYITIKYHPYGDTCWVRTYNGSADWWDSSSAIAVDDSGNVYVTGVINLHKKLASCPDYCTIKYNPYGDTCWVRTYDSLHCFDLATAIAIDDSGYVWVTGNSGTIKYDSSGNPQLLSGNGDAMAVDDAGNVCVTGYYDYVTRKYYPNGGTAWERIYDFSPYDAAKDIVVDRLGNVYVTGYSNCSSDYDAPRDYATIKYKPNGDTIWISRYNKHGYKVPSAIAVDDSGYVYVTGDSSQFGSDYLTIKYDTLLFLRGDANCDGTVSVSDVVYLINYLFKGGPWCWCDSVDPLDCHKGPGDANCDGTVSVSDVVYLINYLFKGGSPPIC
jgi:hypothetical protein